MVNRVLFFLLLCAISLQASIFFQDPANGNYVFEDPSVWYWHLPNGSVVNAGRIPASYDTIYLNSSGTYSVNCTTGCTALSTITLFLGNAAGGSQTLQIFNGAISTFIATISTNGVLAFKNNTNVAAASNPVIVYGSLIMTDSSFQSGGDFLVYGGLWMTNSNMQTTSYFNVTCSTPAVMTNSRVQLNGGGTTTIGFSGLTLYGTQLYSVPYVTIYGDLTLRDKSNVYIAGSVATITVNGNLNMYNQSYLMCGSGITIKGSANLYQNSYIYASGGGSVYVYGKMVVDNSDGGQNYFQNMYLGLQQGASLRLVGSQPFLHQGSNYINVQTGSTLQISCPGVSMRDDNYLRLDATSTVIVDYTAGVVSLPTIENYGTFNVSSGAVVSVSKPFKLFTAGVLNVNDGATVHVNGSATATVYVYSTAKVFVSTSGKIYMTDGASIRGYSSSNDGTIVNNGTIDVDTQTATYANIYSMLINNGRVNVKCSSLSTGGGLQLYSGYFAQNDKNAGLYLYNATINVLSGSNMVVANGKVSGYGTIAFSSTSAALNVQDTLAPYMDGAPRTLNINGNLILPLNALMAFTLSSDTSYDIVKVSGVATINGKFAHTLTAGYSPSLLTAFYNLYYTSASSGSLIQNNYYNGNATRGYSMCCSLGSTYMTSIVGLLCGSDAPIRGAFSIVLVVLGIFVSFYH